MFITRFNIVPDMKIHTTIVIICSVTLSFCLQGCGGLSMKKADSIKAQDHQNHQIQPPSADHIAGLIVQGNSLADKANINEEGNSCPWFLKLENDPTRLLDPINLSEEFQQDDTPVWVIFSGMRRMNRCPEANPVWIQDMVLRNR